MNFRFLHAADLHLGSPFLGLSLKDDDIARRFAAASRAAFSDLVGRAIEEKVAFVVIAGDVYDGEWKDAAIGLFFSREIARLARQGIPAFLIKGNHDAESVVTRTITLPENVRTFPTARPGSFRIEPLRVALHGRSFPDRAVTENIALAYPPAEPGWFNIGVLHTSCDGRPGHAPYAPCTVADLAARGYDYWALGHVHAYEVLCEDPWVVYPGNLQGRSVRECGPKGAVLVEVSDGRVASVEHVAFDHARWHEIVLDMTGVADEPALLERAEAAIAPVAQSAPDRLVALRLRLTGATALHRRLRSDAARLADEVQSVAHRCHDDIWLERLKIETTELAHPPATGAEASIDLSAAMEGLEADPAFREAAAALVQAVSVRLPAPQGEEAPLADDLDALLEEARALVLGRAEPAGGC
ncbi:metallophosphoesterase family protein [Faunimonas sp. B44]|uniref:metallophosphoesterase family protein n=1 Tax=Faunimonas sp. B44 TaxID=3461493 RepID=UPI004043AD47